MNLEKHTLSNLYDLAILARSVYSNGEIISEEFLEWEYNKNPAGKAIAFVAKDELKIASQYVVIPKNVVFENKVVKGSLSLNTITHPVHRGKGYFPKLAELTYAECKKSGVDFTIGFPNKNSVKGFTGKLKFTEISRLPLLLKLNNPFRALFNFVSRKSSDANTEIEIEFNQKSDMVSIIDLEKDLEKYSAFRNKVLVKNFISTDRTPEYMKWRYVDIPLRKYHLFKFEVTGEIVAVMVLRSKKIMGVKCGIVVDYLTIDREHHPMQLFKAVNWNSLDLIIGTVPQGTYEYNCLKNAGFVKVPEFLMFKKLHMIIRRHNENISDSISDFKKWFITFGDYDIF